VEEREAHRLLQLGVAFELDVGTIPEVVEVLALGVHKSLPPAPARTGECGLDLVADGGKRALARPAVGQELDES
jgi:hypothetical protein